METIVTDKISGAGGRYPTAGPQGRIGNGSTKAAPAAPTAPPAAADAVSVTGDAALLQAVDARIASTPEVNSALVENIRSALANGEYQIDGERIAEKLLSAESSLAALLFRN
jgi:negative regulator of flagellin synthesis FlgM